MVNLFIDSLMTGHSNSLFPPHSIINLFITEPTILLNSISIAMKNDCTAVGPMCPADGSSLGYPPSIIASGIFVTVYTVSLVCHLALGFKHKTWVFMSVYCTGSLLDVLGYVGRIFMHNNPYDLNTLVSPSPI